MTSVKKTLSQQILETLNAAEEIKWAIWWSHSTSIDEDFAWRIMKEMEQMKASIETSKNEITQAKIAAENAKNEVEAKAKEISSIKKSVVTWTIGWGIVIGLSFLAFLYDAHWRYAEVLDRYYKMLFDIRIELDKLNNISKPTQVQQVSQEYINYQTWTKTR